MRRIAQKRKPLPMPARGNLMAEQAPQPNLFHSPQHLLHHRRKIRECGPKIGRLVPERPAFLQPVALFLHSHQIEHFAPH